MLGRAVRTRKALRATVVAAVLVVTAGAPASAAGPGQLEILPGEALAAAAADVDADGASEVVRLVGQPPSVMAEVWRITDGRPTLAGSSPAPNSGRVVLVGWRHEGIASLLAVSAPPGSEANDTVCCAELWDLRLGRDGPAFEPMTPLAYPVDAVWALDFDGDATEELLVSSPTGLNLPEPTRTLRVLRRVESDFASVVAIDVPDRDGGSITIGDSDGVGGLDVIIGPARDGTVRRIVVEGAGALVEEMRLALLPNGVPGFIAAAAGGALIEVRAGRIEAVEWPRGGRSSVVGSHGTHPFPSAAVVGSGRSALVLLYEAIFPDETGAVVTVFDVGLRRLGEVSLPELTRFREAFRSSSGKSLASAFEGRAVPYVGPMGGPWNEPEGYAIGGRLISPGGPNGFEVHDISPLIGLQPRGLVGADGAWLLLAGAPFEQTGGSLAGPGRSRHPTLLVPLGDVLAPSAVEPSVSVQPHGAIELSRRALDATVRSGGDGFQLSVSAPTGARVVVSDALQASEAVITERPAVFDVRPPPTEDDGDVDFERWILVVLPDGRGRLERWHGTFVRDGPPLRVTSTLEPPALHATVWGRTVPAASVTVDGRPVATDTSGRFSAVVDAPVWPRHVAVAARDGFGNVSSATLEVVGLVDYRELPLIPIGTAATVLLALILYPRAPGAGMRGRRPSEGPDGPQLIELDDPQGGRTT